MSFWAWPLDIGRLSVNVPYRKLDFKISSGQREANGKGLFITILKWNVCCFRRYFGSKWYIAWKEEEENTRARASCSIYMKFFFFHLACLAFLSFDLHNTRGNRRHGCVAASWRSKDLNVHWGTLLSEKKNDLSKLPRKLEYNTSYFSRTAAVSVDCRPCSGLYNYDIW